MLSHCVSSLSLFVLSTIKFKLVIEKNGCIEIKLDRMVPIDINKPNLIIDMSTLVEGKLQSG